MQTDLVQFQSIILKFIGKGKEMGKIILKESNGGGGELVYSSNQDSHYIHTHLIVNKIAKCVIL